MLALDIMVLMCNLTTLKLSGVGGGGYFKGLTFGLSLYLLLYFVISIHYDSDESMWMHRLFFLIPYVSCTCIGSNINSAKKITFK